LNFEEHYILVNNNELIRTLDNDQEVIDAWEDSEFNTIETIIKDILPIIE
jgi:hypothetical protein